MHFEHDPRRPEPAGWRSLSRTLAWLALGATAASPALAGPAALELSGRLDLDSRINVSGGSQSSPASSALLQWGGSLDTAAAGWWAGGRVDFSLQGVRSWGGLPAATGALQLPSNEWAPNFLRVYQLSYTQALGSLELRAGIMDLNQYFESSDVSNLLHNGTFGMAPNFTANFDEPSFPTTGLGAMANWRVSPDWQARAGAWQAKPPALAGALHDGALSLLEIERDWPGDSADAPPRSDLKLGVWHYRPSLPPAPGADGFGSDASGAYLVGETRWMAGARRWGAFVLAGSSPGGAALVRQFVAGGLLVSGLLPGREQDSASVGVGRVTLRAPHPETFVEAVYAWQLTPRLSLQPDLQWFDHPGGSQPGAWVAGLRLHLGF